VNVVTGKNLELEALVSAFDINVGMGGVSFLRDVQGKLLVDDVFIHPQLWHFLVESHAANVTRRARSHRFHDRFLQVSCFTRVSRGRKLLAQFLKKSPVNYLQLKLFREVDSLQ
jgi:hypothetical protein